MRSSIPREPVPYDVLRARRRALGRDIAAGLLPAPQEFARAGLPVLIRACDLVDVADVIERIPTPLVRVVLDTVSAAERCGWTVPGGVVRRHCS